MLTYIFESEKTFFMKSFLIFIVLFFSIQSWTIADDIKDFEIEGMSVGDSLLKYKSSKDIEKKINASRDKGFVYKSKKYYSITFTNRNDMDLENYDAVQIHLKNKDKKYIIQSISGLTVMENEKCYKEMDTIILELDSLFNSSKKTDKKKRKHVYDETGESTTTDRYYFLNDGSTAAITCTDWSNTIIKNNPGFFDHLRLTLNIGKFDYWLNNEAYD